MAELKPCPFCGGEAKHISFMDLRCHRPACTITCTNCNATIDSFVSQDNTFSYKDHATEAWNKRSESKELQFTRQFIHEHGLGFALASAWNRRTEDGETRRKT